MGRGNHSQASGGGFAQVFGSGRRIQRSPERMSQADQDRQQWHERRQVKTLWLLQYGNRKIATIKAVRSHTGFGLREAKDFVDRAPASLQMKAPEARALAAALEAIGDGTVVEITKANEMPDELTELLPRRQIQAQVRIESPGSQRLHLIRCLRKASNCSLVQAKGWLDRGQAFPLRGDQVDLLKQEIDKYLSDMVLTNTHIDPPVISYQEPSVLYRVAIERWPRKQEEAKALLKEVVGERLGNNQHQLGQLYGRLPFALVLPEVVASSFAANWQALGGKTAAPEKRAVS